METFGTKLSFRGGKEGFLEEMSIFSGLVES